MVIQLRHLTLQELIRQSDKKWKDLEMMGQFTHTGDIENFNSLTNKYCPKMYAYSHASMFVRTALAALDHNENTDREQVCWIVLFLNDF